MCKPISDQKMDKISNVLHENTNLKIVFILIVRLYHFRLIELCLLIQ